MMRRTNILVSKRILDFLYRHDGLQVGFKRATHLDRHVILCFADPWKGVSFDWAVSEEEMKHDAFIKYIVDEAEKEMYGDKEETQ